MKDIFKEGDRVFHIQHGWGTIHAITPIYAVYFDNNLNDLIGFSIEKNKTLSFTEYTLEGFSQERPEELPKKGQIVWVRQEFPSEWRVGHFFKKEGDKYYVSCSPNVVGWTAEGIELRTNNPYEDEQ